MANFKDDDVVIAGYARTPIGAFSGALSTVPATKLGSIAIKGALERSNVPADAVDEVFFGHVLQAGCGQAPARQAAKGAGVPDSVPCTSVNKVCSSGMKAAMLAAQSIRLGDASVVVAGGMESMSNTPYAMPKARAGFRMGHQSVEDLLIRDGLWDVYNDYHMGMAAELCADMHQVDRAAQDDYAIQSYKRAQASRDVLAREIVPVEVPGPRGKPGVTVTQDEEPDKVNFDKVKSLRPAFKRDGGSVTAANASTLNDGAAAMVLMSGAKAKALGITPVARVLSHADAAQAPELFTTSPALAVPKALKKAGLTAEQMDAFEINEAFSVVACANMKLLGVDAAKVNVAGGAVAIGHPLGCSGARIMCTLLTVLADKGGKYGCAGICNGGGGASAIVLERL